MLTSRVVTHGDPDLVDLAEANDLLLHGLHEGHHGHARGPPTRRVTGGSDEL